MIASNPYVLGSRAPARVEEPADAAAVATTLSVAAAARAAVVAFGGATLQSIGNSPRRYDLAIAMRRLDRVLQYDPRELTIGVEAGLTLDALARALGDARQFIPFDAPAPSRATVGGTLAAGWAGPRRAAYGRSRDLMIGSTVALTDGTLATAGGMVVKNVTGYDMSKLYIGSLGTLGILVRANFKALPMPARQRAAIAPLPDDVRERSLDALGALAVEPVAALVIDGFANRVESLHGEPSRLLVLFEGSEAVVDRATRDLRSLLGKCGVAETQLLDGPLAGRALQEAIDAYVEPLDDRSITYRATGSPQTVRDRAQRAREAADAYDVDCERIVDLQTGDAIVRLAHDTRADLAGVLGELDARLRAEIPGIAVLAGDPRVRALVDAWGPPPATIATMRAIKAHFDPGAALAPGRFVGGI